MLSAAVVGLVGIAGALASQGTGRPPEAQPQVVDAPLAQRASPVVGTGPSSPLAPTGDAGASASPPGAGTAELSAVAARDHRVRADSPRASTDWVSRVADATGIPVPAVRAYADATLAIAVDRPGCHLGWTTLAAIGRIESGHGTHGGAVLGADGRPVPAVVGPALDGNGVAAIHATAAGTALHGDPVWEHAVGPLQMLPSTWLRYGADGDGDGAADPNDLDDAALAAAVYLCTGGGDLRAGPAWRQAVLSYNHSDAYVDEVLAAADRYAADAVARVR